MSNTRTLPRKYQSPYIRDNFVIQFFLSDHDRVLTAELRFDKRHEGPPGHAHGGSIASVLDEAMGTLAFATGKKAVAGRLEVRYKKPIPISEALHLSCEIVDSRSRQIRLESKLYSVEGDVLAQATAVFIDVQQRFNALT